MEEKTEKRYMVLLIALCLVLATAVCAQTMHIIKLQKMAESKEPPTRSVRISAKEEPSQPAEPTIGPSRFSQPQTPLDFGFSLNSDPSETFSEMRRMRENIDRMFGDAFSRFEGDFDPSIGVNGFSPNLDLRDEGDKFIVRVDLPGAKKDDIEVNVKDRSLTISGKREEMIEERGKDGGFLRRERRAGQFQRGLTFPEDVQPEAVSAEFRDGVLEITVPKATTGDLKIQSIKIK